MDASPDSQVDPSATDDQYSLGRILGIWAAAALPMGVLGWVVYPALAPDFDEDPVGAGVARVILLTVGLIWLFVLAMIIVYREEGDLHWSTLKRRMWLNTPQDPKTGKPRRMLWWWLVPTIALFGLLAALVFPALDDLLTNAIPGLEPPAGYEADSLFESVDVQAQLEGAWWFLGLFLILAVFNIAGEESVFRGVLLPKMQGVFGRWDWVANGVLFGFYHLHQPWMILTGIVAGFLFALPARRFRSTWMGAIPHAAQFLFIIFLVLGIILGLA